MSRIAIVTGASRGIGKAIFNLFREEKITTIGLSRNIKESEYTEKCDVSNDEQVLWTIADIIEKYGKIDILVNNVGIVSQKDILQISMKEWNEVMSVNLTSCFLCCKYVLPNMIENQYGKIVNISSIAGLDSSLTASEAYTCSKYALVGLTKQLSKKYAKHNININCVCPSQTETEMLVGVVSKKDIEKIKNNNPSKRLAKPIDIANVVKFLVGDDSSYMNGSIVKVSGGL